SARWLPRAQGRQDQRRQATRKRGTESRHPPPLQERTPPARGWTFAQPPKWQPEASRATWGISRRKDDLNVAVGIIRFIGNPGHGLEGSSCAGLRIEKVSWPPRTLHGVNEQNARSPGEGELARPESSKTRKWR